MLFFCKHWHSLELFAIISTKLLYFEKHPPDNYRVMGIEKNEF